MDKNEILTEISELKSKLKQNFSYESNEYIKSCLYDNQYLKEEIDDRKNYFINLQEDNLFNELLETIGDNFKLIINFIDIDKLAKCRNNNLKQVLDETKEKIKIALIKNNNSGYIQTIENQFDRWLLSKSETKARSLHKIIYDGLFKYNKNLIFAENAGLEHDLTYCEWGLGNWEWRKYSHSSPKEEDLKVFDIKQDFTEVINCNKYCHYSANEPELILKHYEKLLNFLNKNIPLETVTKEEAFNKTLSEITVLYQKLQKILVYNPIRKKIKQFQSIDGQLTQIEWEELLTELEKIIISNLDKSIENTIQQKANIDIKLTDKEIQVLTLRKTLPDNSFKNIGAMLNRSEDDIKQISQSIRNKLSASTIDEAIRLFQDKGGKL